MMTGPHDKLWSHAAEGGGAEYGRAEPESVRGVYCRPRCRAVAYGAQSSPASVARSALAMALTLLIERVPRRRPPDNDDRISPV